MPTVFLHAKLADMNRFIRIALLYLLALALPVQGWATATQSVCAPAMHQAGMQITHVETAAAASHDHHQMHASHEQAEQAKVPAEMQAASDAQHDHAAKHAGNHGNATCSACAACYIGMALLPAMPDFVAPPYGSSAAVAATSSFFPGHIPDGIKRPPRHILV